LREVEAKSAFAVVESLSGFAKIFHNVELFHPQQAVVPAEEIPSAFDLEAAPILGNVINPQRGLCFVPGTKAYRLVVGHACGGHLEKVGVVSIQLDILEKETTLDMARAGDRLHTGRLLEELHLFGLSRFPCRAVD
jgi:hypothetical protein